MTFDLSRLEGMPIVNVKGTPTSIKDILIDAFNLSKKVFEDTFSVYREVNNIVLKDTNNIGAPGYQGQCGSYLSFFDDLTKDRTTGIEDSDLHIYVYYYDQSDGTLGNKTYFNILIFIN